MPGAQNTDHLKHVVIFGAENRHSAQLFGNPAAGTSIQLLGGTKGNEHAMPLPEAINRSSNGRKVTLEGSFYVSAVLVEIDSAVVAVFVSATDCVCGIFH